MSQRETPRTVLARWLVEIQRRNEAYWVAATRLERRAQAWAIPNIILSAVAGLGSTAQALGSPVAPWVLWTSAGAGVAAAITASLLRVFRYHERAGSAREVAKRYAILLHDAEAALTDTADPDARDVLARVRSEFNRLVDSAEDAPTMHV